MKNSDNNSFPAREHVSQGKIIHSSADLLQFVSIIRRRSRLINVRAIGHSVRGRPLYALEIGKGEKTVLINASHHANEYITTTILTRFLTELEERIRMGGARELFEGLRVLFVPLVNPDGVELVTGALRGRAYDAARSIAQEWPDIPFPSGWKANFAGVDLNLQYPARWEMARSIKGAAGFTAAAPRDWPGPRPLFAPESRAMYYYTQKMAPTLTLSFHTQGETIFWKYTDMEPPGSRQLAEKLAAASGYAMEETPYASGFAGYKDWFISEYNLPGYTIEAGLGESPLPEEDFEQIYAPCEALLRAALEAITPPPH